MRSLLSFLRRAFVSKVKKKLTTWEGFHRFLPGDSNATNFQRRREPGIAGHESHTVIHVSAQRLYITGNRLFLDLAVLTCSRTRWRCSCGIPRDARRIGWRRPFHQYGLVIQRLHFLQGRGYSISCLRGKHYVSSMNN